MLNNILDTYLYVTLQKVTGTGMHKKTLCNIVFRKSLKDIVLSMLFSFYTYSKEREEQYFVM